MASVHGEEFCYDNSSIAQLTLLYYRSLSLYVEQNCIVVTIIIRVGSYVQPCYIIMLVNIIVTT